MVYEVGLGAILPMYSPLNTTVEERVQTDENASLYVIE